MGACATQRGFQTGGSSQDWCARGHKLIQFSLPVQELELRRIPQYRNPKQRSRAPHAPHASTTVTYRIFEVLPLCLKLNESKICCTGDTAYIFLYKLAYVGIRPLGTPKASSSTRQTRAIFSRKRLRPVWARQITSRCSHLASHLLHM